jgi:hypothetical protein
MPAMKKTTMPRADKLTDAERKTYKSLHEKYGSFGKSPLNFAVAGESDQTFDIELKLGK